MRKIKVSSHIGEVMLKPGEIPWNVPNWHVHTPYGCGPYLIHYSFYEKMGEEFIGVDYFIEGKWCRRWTNYPRFEWKHL
jgi:hypothetical protein